MTPLKFTLDRNLLILAARANNRAKWPRFVIAFMLFAVLVGVAVDYLGGNLSVNGTAWTVALMLGTALATSAAMFLITIFVTIPHKVSRALMFFDDAQRAYEVDWDEINFRISSTEGNASIKFARLAGWKRTAGHILVYRTDDHYYIIPRESLDTNAALPALIDHLKGAGVPEK